MATEAQLRAGEIKGVLLREIEGYSDELKVEEVGAVLEVKDGVARGVLAWRAGTQWLGGLGALLFVVAVGFLPGATAEDVTPVLDAYSARMGTGDTVCVSLNSPLGDLLGFGFLVGSTGPLTRHGANIERIMTDPARRGTNYGALLMAGLHRVARERGVELVTLDYRGGTGLGEFYTQYGYTEVGRVPGALRVAAGDDRDGVIMARSL